MIINGQKKLRGSVTVSGAKNAAEPVIFAAAAADGVCVIENLPRIKDVKVLAAALESVGAVCRFLDEHTLEIDSTRINKYKMDCENARSVRSSYYMWGILLRRFGKAVVPMPGGDNLGLRPIDQHIKGFEALGAKVVIDHGDVVLTAERLIGASVYLDVVSVGATINIMIAAAQAQGTTTIENAAKEPHVVDTANFLNMMGAKIKGAGTDTIRIVGVERLRGVEYTIIPDQIEAGTYMIAAAITGGDVKVCNIIPKHMDSLSAKLIEMNCLVEEGDDYIRVRREGELRCANVKTMAYPGFPTDLQPQMTALLALAGGTSIVTETIYDNRFRYIAELKR
ncbi:MAG: UDP-N-acetylglucosamine 1-carboxyvinyltransferase, partial [Defluviitaleaceae bacterium]|nr:UDP-N-acetylglucosamine 1-carboxyvinyltransferase [Defluviitaleaceae bacterium]